MGRPLQTDISRVHKGYTNPKVSIVVPQPLMDRLVEYVRDADPPTTLTGVCLRAIEEYLDRREREAGHADA